MSLCQRSYHPSWARWMMRKPQIKMLTISQVSYATAGLHVFDQETKKWQRNKSAQNQAQSREVDYLKDEIAERLADRLLVYSLRLFSRSFWTLKKGYLMRAQQDIKRSFHKVLDLGSGAGHFTKFIDRDMLKELVMADTSSNLFFLSNHNLVLQSKMLKDSPFLFIFFIGY